MKAKMIFVTVIALLFVTVTSCKEDGNNSGEPENYSLVGTSWKLVGLVDAKTGKLTEFEPKDCEECYTLTFDTEIVEPPGIHCWQEEVPVPYYNVTGKTCSNNIFGEYYVDLDAKILECCISITRMAEATADGDMFHNILIARNSFPFELIRVGSQQQLRLYRLYDNDDKNYLLFKKIGD